MEFFSNGNHHVGVRFDPDDDPVACTRVKRVLGRTCFDAYQEKNDFHVLLPDEEDAQRVIETALRVADIVPSKRDAHDAVVDMQRVGQADDDAPFVMSRFSPFKRR